MKTEIIELHPSSRLLPKAFLGYNLTLEPTPFVKLELTSIPQYVVVFKDGNNDSMLFNQHNALIRDPWNPYNMFYIDDQLDIHKVKYVLKLARLKLEGIVYSIIKSNDKENERCRASLTFINEKFAVTSDGSGIVYLLETGNRSKYKPWLCIGRFRGSEAGYVISDARLDITDTKKQLHCLLLRKVMEDNTLHNVIDWIIATLTDAKVWKKTASKQLRGGGSLYYCALEHKSRAILIGSDRRFRFTQDTDIPISHQDIKEVVINSKPPEKSKKKAFKCPVANSGETQVSITWYETLEEVIVIFQYKEFLFLSQLNIKLTPTHLRVKYYGHVFANDELFDRVIPELLYYSLEKPNEVHMTLTKKTPMMWLSVTANLRRVFRKISTPEITSKQAMLDKPSSEKCVINPTPSDGADTADEADTSDAANTSDLAVHALERLCAQDHVSTHFVKLGETVPLFSPALVAGALPLLVTKHKSDAILWEIPKTLSQWPPQHYGTLPEFGDVKSLNQNKPFITCSPDFKFSVLCESDGRVLIYISEGSCLSNMPRETCIRGGEQRVVSVDSMGEVIGVQAENEAVFILTRQHVAVLQLSN